MRETHSAIMKRWVESDMWLVISEHRPESKHWLDMTPRHGEDCTPWWTRVITISAPDGRNGGGWMFWHAAARPYREHPILRHLHQRCCVGNFSILELSWRSTSEGIIHALLFVVQPASTLAIAGISAVDGETAARHHHRDPNGLIKIGTSSPGC